MAPSYVSASSRNYEVQVYAKGQWRPVDAFDDRLTAIDRAKELAENPRFLSVKVMKEQFDELRQLYVQQTVYRSAPMRDETPFRQKREADAYKRLGDRRRERLRREQVLEEARKARRRQKLGRVGFAISLTVRLLLILGIGFATLYWILTQYRY
jgi:hypothetical protein